jgi:hypothetical protein
LHWASELYEQDLHCKDLKVLLSYVVLLSNFDVVISIMFFSPGILVLARPTVSFSSYMTHRLTSLASFWYVVRLIETLMSLSTVAIYAI